MLAVLILANCLLAQVNVTTQRNDNARTGQNLSESILSTANVNSTSFGKLFSYNVDGYVYAQPLYVANVSIPNQGTHNVIYVATEHDSVFAFDADSNSGSNANPLWSASFINPAKGITTVSSSDVSCGDLVPEIGVTGTPVIDLSTGTMYLVAKTKENGNFVQRLHALDITTGAEKFGGPVVIRAQVPGTGDGGSVVKFNALRAGQRSGLLLQNGYVYIAWASHCDITPYHGWVISYSAQTLKQTGVWNSTPNGGLGGVWAAGSGLAADSSFNLYVSTGNGTFDLNTKGGRDAGDSIVKLTSPSGKLSAADYFTPYNQATLDNEDLDLGSGGVTLLPDQTGPYTHLLVESGKEGSIYLVNRDKMGHYNSSNNNQIVQFLPYVIGGMWSTPTWWNNNVYFGGSYDFLRTFSFDPSTGLLSPSSVSQTPTYFNFPGPSPSVSANGTSQAIVWALQNDAYASSGPAILHAYDATNLANELYNSNQNPARDGLAGAVKFTVPTIANGKVYVGTETQVSVFGLLP